MIYNTKTFYAVGQGGFYSERIWNSGHERTIVYDCGVEGNCQILKDNVKNSGLEKVDYVVVSHLDDDHISGLKELESHIKKIDANWNPVLILPKPNPLDLLLFYTTTSHDNIEYFFGGMSNIRQLHITDEKVKDDLFDLDAEWNGVKSISHNCRVFTGSQQCTEKWLLKFYVDASIYQNKLTKRDAKIISSVKTLDDFEKKKEKLKEIYRETKEKQKKLRQQRKKRNLPNKGDSSEMNLSSMAMVSAPFCENLWTRNCNRGLNSPYISWMNGDIRLKNKNEMAAIEQHFADFLSLNIDFQVPHHGSCRNLGCVPNFNRRARTYIWAGEDNPYGHPNGTILRMLKRAGLEINWITEEDSHIVRHENWI